MNKAIPAARVAAIDALLPQTQCQQCGFAGCKPYALALAQGIADINQCPPGGEAVIRDLARLLRRPVKPLAKPQPHKAIAVIVETDCIGCAACIKACPVDAIVGANKHMHTVLSDECTGCALCQAPCPVDCIVMQIVPDAWLPRARSLADTHDEERHKAASHARVRYQNHQNRLKLQRRKKPLPVVTATQASSLIQQAMQAAQASQDQRVALNHHNEFVQQQLQKAKYRANQRYQHQQNQD